MDEVSNPGAVQEETQVQTESAAPQMEATQEAIAQSSEAKTQSQPDQQDKSWIKKVRRDRDDAIRRADEAERKAKMQEELMKQFMANQAPQAAPEEDILQQIQKEEYVPGEKVAKALRKQQEDFDRKLADLKKLQDQQYFSKQEDQIRATHPDYDDVVNPDTLDLLKETNPKLFNRVANLLKVDQMDGAIFAYETIVGQGLVDKIPDSRRAKEIDKKLEQNKKTVQTPQAYDKRPLAQAFQMPQTKKEKEALWAETQKYASMAGGY